ncbi:hypothetical protein ADICEAN_01789 [Cesiribacter andamanensis AMV16]|uniref:Uncharacterized protein n=1 Tax=Cesiribacter andamanensis AMV16 TaxID=1279009 RepID=M7NMS0_9BACT|nr:hypothetical protein ADICEAN_01789 [Cesiribacter andamanensis AMV16]
MEQRLFKEAEPQVTQQAPECGQGLPVPEGEVAQQGQAQHKQQHTYSRRRYQLMKQPAHGGIVKGEKQQAAEHHNARPVFNIGAQPSGYGGR